MRKATILTALLVGVLAVEHAMAFSFMGPLEGWQTVDIDYPGDYFQDFFAASLELGGTKNLGEEYRLSTPVITYAYDSSFLDYFGTVGVKAVDSAFAFMNTLPPVSSMSHNLSEYLTEGNQRINQRAQALFLVDMKSTMIQLLVEHMGLAGETHVFDLSDRLCPVACGCNYGVIVRNFDPITWEPSHYVNGKLWTYAINEACVPAIASAVEIPVATTGSGRFTAVATPFSLVYGGYFLSLTRDDMGGLRYLYRKNNYNTEPLPAGASASIITAGSAAWSVPSFWGAATNAAGGGQQNVVTNVPMLTGGIEKVRYVKMHFNNYLGTGFLPVTISYTVPVLSGYKVTNLHVTRTNNAPDILITAANFAVNTVYGSATRTAANGGFSSIGASSPIGSGMVVYRTISFSSAVTNTVGTGVIGTGLAGTIGGPGIINPQMQVIFNKMGPSFENDNTFFFNEQQTSFTTPQLAVFDGSTNAPLVFPITSSIQNMEAQLLVDPGLNGNIGVSPVFNPVVVSTNTTPNGQ